MFSRKASAQSTSATSLPGRDEAIEISGIHFVTGASMVPPFPESAASVSFGMGCFWGAERVFWPLPGVLTTAVGYQGGLTPNPTYREVCTERTGHAEVVLVVYDPEQTSLETLLKHFWEQHDPTTANRQGNDVGTQYRSAIFWTDQAQREVAVASKAAYQAGLSEAGYGTISTEIAEAGPFYYAEEYHQQYLAKNPGGYCNHGFCQIEYATSDA